MPALRRGDAEWRAKSIVVDELAPGCFISVPGLWQVEIPGDEPDLFASAGKTPILEANFKEIGRRIPEVILRQASEGIGLGGELRGQVLPARPFRDVGEGTRVAVHVAV